MALRFSKQLMRIFSIRTVLITYVDHISCQKAGRLGTPYHVEWLASPKRQTPPLPGNGTPSSELFVSNLPASATEAFLRERLVRYGEIVEVRLLKNPDGSCRG